MFYNKLFVIIISLLLKYKSFYSHYYTPNNENFRIRSSHYVIKFLNKILKGFEKNYRLCQHF